MRNAYLMFRVQLSQMLGLNRVLRISDKKLRRKKLAIYILVALSMGLIVPVFGLYFYLMAAGLKMAGMLSLFPGLICMMAGLVTLITSIPVASGMLYGAKDYELILPLPVRDGEIAASRMGVIYAVDLLFTIGVMLPAGAIYAYFAAPAPWFYPCYALLALLTPMAPLVLGCALGALAAKITARFPGARYLQMILLTAVSFGIMYLSIMSSMRADTDEVMLLYWTDLAKMVGGMVNRAYPPSMLFTAAIVDGSASAFAAYAALSLALFAAFSALIGKSLRSVNTLMTTTRAHGKYSLKAMRVQSPLGALYKKEMKRYLASPIYVFNTGFGLLMLLVMGILLVTMGQKYIPLIAMALRTAGLGAALMPLMGALIAGFMLSTADISASSISLEGKQAWIVKSLPVSGMAALAAKLFTHLVVTVPVAVLFGAALIASFRPDAATACLCVLMPVAYALFVGLAGLLVNLRWYTFDWQTETAVVKQGAAVGITMLIGMAATLLPVGLYALAHMSALTSCAVATAALLVACGAMLLHMKRYGDALLLRL